MTSGPLDKNLILKGTPNTIRKAKAIITTLDQPLNQIEIEVKFIEISTESLSEYEAIFDQITSGKTLTFSTEKPLTLPIKNISATLKALSNSGKANLLATPKITTLENKKAFIEVGDRHPYITSITNGDNTTTSLKHINTGITLELKGKITNENIEIEINAHVSEIKLWKNLSTGRFPVISDRHFKTTLRTTHNQSILIAGLIKKDKKTTQRQTPFLSKIPIINRLFKASFTETIHSDILVFITPKIKTPK